MINQNLFSLALLYAPSLKNLHLFIAQDGLCEQLIKKVFRQLKNEYL